MRNKIMMIEMREKLIDLIDNTYNEAKLEAYNEQLHYIEASMDYFASHEEPTYDTITPAEIIR